MQINIRAAIENDIPSLTEINNYYIVNGYASLRLETESVEERMEKFSKMSQTGPYQMLVAEFEGKVLGVASSFRYREGPVFEKTVETGIALDPKMLGKGIGFKLYESLFESLSKQDIHLVVAGIALPNPGSVALHQKVGFSEVGVFDEYAYYRGKFYSSLWMQKRIYQEGITKT